MAEIIPRELIRHLEWTPGQENPETDKGGKSKVQPPRAGDITGDFSKYIQVGINGLYGNPVLISPFELEGYNNLKYNRTHFKLLDNGLYMPTPLIFMTHFNNVIEASQGKRTLWYADGSEVPDEEVNDMSQHLTRNHRNVYGDSNVGTWTWLNGKVVSGDGFNGLSLETVVDFTRATKKRQLKVNTERLEECLWEDAYINFSFNSQGLAKPDSKSDDQNYVLGSNIRFWYPREGCVARFGASSDWAGLFAGRIPAGTYSSLGVYGCAEGAQRKIFGGSE